MSEHFNETGRAEVALPFVAQTELDAGDDGRRARRRETPREQLVPTVRSPQPSPERSFTKQDTFISCDGWPLWLRFTTPDRTALDGVLVFVHGNTFPALADFDLQVEGGSLVERLAALGFASCLFDHRGFGRSYKPKKSRLGVRERARDLAVVLKHIQETRAPRQITLVGLSSASLVIAELLRSSCRSLVSSIVLLGPNYCVNDYLLGLIRKLKLAYSLRRLIGEHENSYLTFRRETLLKRLTAGEDRHISKARIECFLDASIEAMEPGARTLRSPVIGFFEPHRRYAIGLRLFDASVFEQPILVIRGELDDFCNQENVRALARDVSSKTFVEHCVPGVKHDLGLYPAGQREAIEALSDFVFESWRSGDGSAG